jgi:hypothetical protein
MVKLLKQISYRWSFLGLVFLIVIGGLVLTIGKTSALASDPQGVLEAYLDSIKAGNSDKAFSYVTYNGKSEAAMRKEFESAIKSDKLLSYKINKFFNDDDIHASASITIKFLNQGEQRSVNELIKENGVWKITRDMSPSSADGPLKQDNLNENDNRPSQAVIYQMQEDVRNGKVGTAQPSIQPSVK